ncbi:MAG TPA: hypothetical protein VF167_04035 [Longimicrobiaceae bacterium]
MHTIAVRSRRIAQAFLAIVLALLLASTIGQLATYRFNNRYVRTSVDLFSLNGEANVPSWFASICLLLCAQLLAVVAVGAKRSGDRWWKHWLGLAGLFVLLSLDEIASLHELADDPVREVLGVGGLLYWAWVVPGMLFVALVGLIHVRFVLSLPGSIRNLFILSAALYVGGAIGVEMPGGAWFEGHGRDMVYALLWTIEETLEMLGVTMFMYALLRHLEDRAGVVTLELAEDPEPQRAA